jgi:uncharacterized protein involved in exopolysaccharide biosynthesis
MGVVGFSFSPIGRGIARRLGGETVNDQDVTALREEVVQLRAEIDELHGRLEQMDELANRVDFAERMLAQVRAGPGLPAGGGQ